MLGGGVMPTTYDRIDLLEMKLRIAVEALREAPCLCWSRYVDSEGKEHNYDDPCPRCAALKAIDEARIP